MLVMYKEFLNTLIENNLSQDGFLILYSLYNKQSYLIKDYTNACGKISTDIFYDLQNKNLIKINKVSDSIFYEFLSLTEEGLNLYRLIIGHHPNLVGHTPPKESVGNFDDFRKHYPIKVGYRRLHQDLKRCRKLYDKLLQETTHEILCKSADRYWQEAVKSGSTEYMPLMATWLSKEHFRLYSVEELNEEINITKGDDI